MSNETNHIVNKHRIAILTFSLCFVAFSFGLCPGLYWGDDGLLIAASVTMGIGHPPGHPVYMMLNRVALGIPFGCIAFRYNVMAAFWLSLAIAIMVRAIIQKTQDQFLKNFYITSFCAFVLTHVFAWHQAVRAETYSIHALLLILSFLSICLRKDGKGLMLGSFFAALMLGNQLFLAALAGPGLIFGWISVWMKIKNKIQPLLGSIIVFVLGLSVYSYSFIRSGVNPVVNWTILSNFSEKWMYVTAQTYRQSFFVSGSDSAGIAMSQRLLDVVKELAATSMWIIPVLLVSGLIVTLIYKKEHLLLVTGYAIVLGTIAGTAFCGSFDVENWDFQGYLLPVVVLMPFVTMLAWKDRLELNHREKKAMTLVFLLGGCVPGLVSSSGGYRSLASSREAVMTGQIHLDSTAEDGILLVRSDVGFITEYLMVVEKYRDDIRQISRNFLDRNAVQAELRLRYPGLTWPNSMHLELSGYSEFVRAFVHMNSGRQLYWELADDTDLIADVPIMVSGSLIELFPRQAKNANENVRFEVLFDQLNQQKSPRLFKDRQAVEQLSMLFYNLGTMFLNRYQTELSIEYLERALRLDTSQARIHNNYGVALTRLDRNSEALSYFLKALEIDPNYEGALQNADIMRGLIKE